MTPVAKAKHSTPAKKSKRERWQAYIDDALLRTGQVNQAAIFSLDGVQWAASANFKVCDNVVMYTKQP